MSLFKTANVYARSSREGLVSELNRWMTNMTGDALLEAVLDHSSLILWAIDVQGNFILSRGAGLRELGLVDDQVVGQNVEEMYAGFPEILQSIRESLAGKEHHDIVELNGSIFESWYCPLRDEQGNVVAVVGISSAITELASTRQALYDATLHFHLAFQESPMIMAILKIPSGELIEVNKAFQEITGYRQEEVRGLTPGELLLWERPWFLADQEIELIHRDSFHDERIQAISRTGDRIELIASGAKFRFQAEDCLLLFARDATAEIKIKQALQKSEQRFAMLARQAPVGIFQCNAAGEILYANGFFWSCFQQELPCIQNPEDSGYLTAIANIPWYSLFKTEQQSDLLKDWQAACEQQIPFRRELQLEETAQGIEWVQLQLDRLPNEEGNFLGSLGDITAIKRSESASILHRQELEKAVRNRTMELEKLNQQLLKEVEQRKLIAHELQLSKEHLQTVLQNAADYIIHINKAGCIEFVNRMADGFSPDQVLGRHVSEWFVRENREESLENLRRILEDGESTSTESPVKDLSGNIVYMAVRGAPIRLDGKIIGASLVARDITREKELEEQARQRLAQLSHLSRLNLVGEMSASMSHELKQPLLAIGNYAEGCLKRIQEGLIQPAEALEYLQTINKLAQKSRDILKRTRDFVANRPYAPQPTCLRQLTEDSLQFVHAEIHQHKITVQQDFAPSLPQSCVDPIQIQQVIVNLLMNAVEAISASSKQQEHFLKVATRCLNDRFVLVSIQDSADGVDAEMQETLFDAFKSSKKEGLGMGLAISRSIVENHGGTLKIQQTGPAGTTFEMTLPIC